MNKKYYSPEEVMEMSKKALQRKMNNRRIGRDRDIRKEK